MRCTCPCRETDRTARSLPSTLALFASVNVRVADRVRALLNPLPIGRPMLLAWAAAMAIGALLAAEWDATADLVDFLARCWS